MSGRDFLYLCNKCKNLYMTITRRTLFTILVLLGTGFTGMLFGQSGEPWTAKELIEPASLAGMITAQKGQKPVIFNIGPLADIRGAVNIGSTGNKAGLDKLAKAASTVSKEATVVIYCGCCPFRNCPNIRPAFNLLKEKGYKNLKLLNLKQNLKVDWTDYGYPMN